MSGVIRPLPNTPSWRGAQLKRKHRDNFTFLYINYHSLSSVVLTGLLIRLNE